MSSLRCPVCQSAFREVLKEGILIDVCTQCRGVWLDRGELEKLLSLARADGEPDTFEAQRETRPVSAPSRAPEYRPSLDERQRHYDHDDDDDDHKRYGSHHGHERYGHKKKKKGLDFLDIFDFGD